MSYRDRLKVVQIEMGKVETDLKAALAKELGLEGHPKFDKLYTIAYQHGHSSGFNEVAMYAEEFSELLCKGEHSHA